MKIRNIFWRSIAALLLAFLAGAARTSAQDPGADLQDQIDDLRRRLSSIERALGPQQELEQTLARLKASADRPAGAGAVNVGWKNGLTFQTQDGSLKMKIGGRLHADLGFAHGDGDVNDAVFALNGSDGLADGQEIRRARFYVQGTYRDRLEFKTQYDFAGGDADFKDAWVDFKKVSGVGNLKLGVMKENFNITQTTSSNYVMFMERALPVALLPDRSLGVMIHDKAADHNVAWTVGAFRMDESGDKGFAKGDGDINYTARVTGAPILSEDGTEVVHLGVAVSRRRADKGTVRYRSRPEAHLAEYFVDTGKFSADDIDLVGLEAAAIHGPLSAVATWVQARTNPVGEHVRLQGYSLQGGWFFTGEHRPYSLSSGSFGRVKPHEDAITPSGWNRGAWEGVARYSFLDLNDGTVAGGKLSEWTLGLNWFLDPNVRVMWNLVRPDLDGVGHARFFEMRVQVVF